VVEISTFCWKFYSLSNSKRTFLIGYDLTKLRTKIKVALFYTAHSVESCWIVVYVIFESKFYPCMAARAGNGLDSSVHKLRGMSGADLCFLALS